MSDRDSTRPPYLNEIYQQIEDRVAAITKQQPSWPCHKGCDHCCRRLTTAPILTRAEWDDLGQGLRKLDRQTRAQIRQRVAALAGEVEPEVPSAATSEAASADTAKPAPASLKQATPTTTARIPGPDRHVANPRRIICPLLDRDAGTCLVYDHRPAACRMYGFYVSRGQGHWCGMIQDRIEKQGDGDIIWGNHDASAGTIERAFGPAQSLLDWFKAD